MRGSELRRRLREGKRVYGTMIVSPSPKWPEQIRHLGLDFVFLDTEHISLDRHQLSWMCQTYKAMDICPIVRIPSPDPYQASMAIDAGASGIIAPYVESAEQVQKLRGAVKYKPLKGEKLDRILDGKEMCEPHLQAYLEEYNDERVLIVNIESQPAMRNLDDILQVPGLDSVLIGPHDLTCSLDIPEQYQHPRFEEAVRFILKKARDYRIGAGIHFWPNTEQIVRWIQDAGLNMIVYSTDINSFAVHVKTGIDGMKQQFGDSVTTTAKDVQI